VTSGNSQVTEHALLWIPALIILAQFFANKHPNLDVESICDCKFYFKKIYKGHPYYLFCTREFHDPLTMNSTARNFYHNVRAISG